MGAASNIFLVEMWRGGNELMAHIHAPYLDFNGSKHFKGSFRSVVELYAGNESKEHCSFGVWRYYYRTRRKHLHPNTRTMTFLFSFLKILQKSFFLLEFLILRAGKW